MVEQTRINYGEIRKELHQLVEEMPYTERKFFDDYCFRIADLRRRVVMDITSSSPVLKDKESSKLLELIGHVKTSFSDFLDVAQVRALSLALNDRKEK